MPDVTRRDLIRGTAAVLGAAAAAGAPAASALARTSGRRRSYGDLRDVRHVVILMQENRSFDH